MTKKEVFDNLKGTKVVLKTEDEQVKLQEFLFSIGCKWQTIKSTEVMKMYNNECMFFIDMDGFISHNEYASVEVRAFCDTHAYKELKIDDILRIEIDKDKEDWKD